jgi:hypothetical protein
MSILQDIVEGFSLDSYEIEHIRENLPLIEVEELDDFQAFHLGLITHEQLIERRVGL